ncbi:MAG: ElyC/SanA/YdcF family protein [Verrucomicrobiota bacterium]
MKPEPDDNPQPPEPAQPAGRRSLMALLWAVPWWARWAIALVLAVPALIIAMNLWVIALSEPYVYRNLEALPSKKVGLVLGTSPRVKGGQRNTYFTQRMDAAAALFQADKIRHIIVSGDNRSRYYNEPKYMRDALLERGVPREAITLDYAGFRTLDSMVRAKRVFGQSSIIVITNDFHLNRAIFIGREHHEDVIGFAAGDQGGWKGLRHHGREVGSRVLAFLDVYFLDTQPYYPGPPEPLEVPPPEPITRASATPPASQPDDEA